MNPLLKLAAPALSGLIPGAGPLISIGLELLKGLLGNKDLKGAEDVLGLLENFMKKGGGAETAPNAQANPAQAQPFTLPPNLPPGTTVEIEVRTAKPNGKPIPHEKLPEVDGSPAGDQMLSQKASQFVEGSEANKAKALQPGSNDWTTIMWAMQSNPNVHYNADTQRFFAKTEGGGKMDLGSLEEMKAATGGNFDRYNPVGMGKIKEALDSKMAGASSTPEVSSIIYRITTAAAKSDDTEATSNEPKKYGNPKIDKFAADLKAAQEAQDLMVQYRASAEVSYTSFGSNA